MKLADITRLLHLGALPKLRGNKPARSTIGRRGTPGRKSGDPYPAPAAGGVDVDAACRAARTRERARCAAIFASEHATGRADLAANLAFNTDMTSKEAIGVLATAGKSAAPPSLRARMAGMETLRPGQDIPGGQPSAASGWVASARRVGVLPKAATSNGQPPPSLIRTDRRGV